MLGEHLSGLLAAVHAELTAAKNNSSVPLLKALGDILPDNPLINPTAGRARANSTLADAVQTAVAEMLGTPVVHTVVQLAAAHNSVVAATVRRLAFTVCIL